ncbi:hypothetical protein BJY16_004007 [Actinoplanes octamycinicus]|uniref:Uncharacterized protein n=1 Tax=Actinoplanes octamycinicus TaxID=135948 RepID=A0A7W7GYD7_9ACTN|nr:hypothetical protein [Actinoplanes octamycinicus]MBB4740548.1 hypothetical protein [Actinoplanes octamycinicus]GIE59806.1 hypothetical protein Aoc01nite_52080 [Actinoplanes octamycinicus]
MTETGGPSVRALFFDSPGDAVAAMTKAVRSGAAAGEIRDGLGRMPAAGKDAVLAEVGKVADGILEMGVTDLLDEGWNRYTALTDAAAKSLANPGGRELVEMASHTASVDYRPAVEVHLADLPVATVGMRALLEFQLRGLVAVVADGALTALRAGTWECAGTLELAGQQVARREGAVDMPAEIRFSRPIPLR